MDRSQKTELVSDIREKLSSAELIVVTHQKGITVGEATELRRQVRAAGAEFKVLKNTLAHIAVQDSPFEALQSLLKGPTALSFSKDPVAAAKSVVEFAKKNDKLQVLGACLNGKLINAEGVKALAELPSLDGMRAMLLGVIAAPASKLVRTINEPGSQLARVLDAKAKA